MLGPIFHCGLPLRLRVSIEGVMILTKGVRIRYDTLYVRLLGRWRNFFFFTDVVWSVCASARVLALMHSLFFAVNAHVYTCASSLTLVGRRKSEYHVVIIQGTRACKVWSLPHGCILSVGASGGGLDKSSM